MDGVINVTVPWLSRSYNEITTNKTKDDFTQICKQARRADLADIQRWDGIGLHRLINWVSRALLSFGSFGSFSLALK